MNFMSTIYAEGRGRSIDGIKQPQKALSGSYPIRNSSQLAFQRRRLTNKQTKRQSQLTSKGDVFSYANRITVQLSKDENKRVNPFLID
nr:unnamed protein product [Callosobruchus chinensis]